MQHAKNAPESASKQSIGWIGVGKMGAPMARRALSYGYPVQLLEPIPENRAGVVAEGASVADSLEEIASRCDIVVSMIPNDEVLLSLVGGERGLAALMRPDQIFLEMSTVSPEASAQVASQMAAADIPYVRAPVSGSTSTALDGQLTIIASGPVETYRAVEPLLSTFSAKRYFVGPAEEARYMKLVLNTLVGATSAILAEAFALGRQGGLSRETMLEVVCQSAVASPLIAYKRDLILEGEFAPAFSVDQMIKDFDLISQAAKSRHVPMFTASVVRQLYESARAQGYADRDFFVLLELQDRLAGIDGIKGRK